MQTDSRSCCADVSKNKTGSPIEISDHSVKGLQSKYHEGMILCGGGCGKVAPFSQPLFQE
jgi:hypothetical protein